MNEYFLIEYAGEFYWNGRIKKKGDPSDPKLYWTTDWVKAGKLNTMSSAENVQKRIFNYPTRIVRSIFDFEN